MVLTPKKSLKTPDSEEMANHDLLSSLHAIKLGLSQLKNSAKENELIHLIEEEVHSVEFLIQKKFINKKVFFLNELVEFTREYFLNAYPEKSWRDLFSFYYQDVPNTSITVTNLKQILRNIAINMRENNNKNIQIKFLFDSGFSIQIESTCCGENKSVKEGIGLFSIKSSLINSGGQYSFKKTGNRITQVLCFGQACHESLLKNVS